MDDYLYPDYARWVALLNGRDTMILVLAAAAFAGLIWLLYARAWFPGWLVRFRWLLVGFWSVLFLLAGAYFVAGGKWGASPWGR